MKPRSDINLVRYGSFSELDVDRFKYMMNNAFKKPLPDSYYENAEFHEMIMAESSSGEYIGASIIEQPGNFAYLDKIFRKKGSMIFGIGTMLFDETAKRNESICWRCNNEKIHSWYEMNSSGFVEKNGWHIFWRNLEGDALDQAIEYAQSKPNDWRRPYKTKQEVVTKERNFIIIPENVIMETVQASQVF